MQTSITHVKHNQTSVLEDFDLISKLFTQASIYFAQHTSFAEHTYIKLRRLSRALVQIKMSY